MNPDIQKILSLGLGAATLIVSIVLVVMAIGNWTSTNNQIAVAEANSGLPPAADPARYLVTGSSRAESSADLQDRLEGAATDAGLDVSSIRIAPVVDANPLHMTVDVAASGGMREIAIFLHAVESSLPALIVSRTRISPTDAEDRLQLEVRIEAQRSPGGNP